VDDLNACNLAGCRVLVTRAAHQSQELCRLIDDLDGRPLHMPAIEIQSVEPNPALAEVLGRLATFDIALFISANAVEWGLKLLPEQRLPDGIAVAAVGQATALALARSGHTVAVVPEHGFDSESLLESPELSESEVRGRSVVIFRGEGGRALLGDTLRKRGAKVAYAEVYRRCCPQTRTVAGIDWRLEDVDIATATSNMVLDNLFTMFDAGEQERLRNMPLVVISERMLAHARKLGCRQVLLAPGPGDRDLIEAICAWLS
jgi:uroporphyrinogen-III synthase